MSGVVCSAWLYPERMLQETFRNEFLGLFKVLLGMVDVPYIDKDGRMLRNAIPVVNIVLRGGMGDCLRGNWTPAVHLLDNQLC